MKKALYVPFKFKLTLIISLILLVLLFVTYQIVKHDLETQFISRIHSDLYSTQDMIRGHLDESFKRLSDTTNAIIGHVYVKEVLTDKNMDEATRDDLITDEIYSYFSENIDLIIVADTEGNILASNNTGKNVIDDLKKFSIFRNCLDYGDSGLGFIYREDSFYQIVIDPYFLNEEMIGLVCIGKRITEHAIGKIKEISGVELAFLNGSTIFLSTKWSSDPKQNDLYIREFNMDISASSKRQTKKLHLKSDLNETRLFNERFLYFITPFRSTVAGDLSESNSGIITYMSKGRNEIGTEYLVIKSLDKELSFLRKLLKKIVLTGFIGVCLAIVIGFLFSLKITQPIGYLQNATSEIEKGNFKHRLDINSNDEFVLLGDSFNSMAQGLEEKEQVRSAMDKVVSKEIAEEMLKGKIELGGEEKYATILFSDIREFTTLSEGLQPTTILQLLNQYFTYMSKCIEHQHGIIDKYIGDAMMAVFGVLDNQKNDVVRAVSAAQEMLEELEKFNNDTANPPIKKIKMGIGINTGKLVAGNVGTENRLNYTVLGDEVNLASRLEGLCKVYNVPIIISGSTYEALIKACTDSSEKILTRELDTVQVMGKTQGIRIYQVFEKNTNQGDFFNLISEFNDARTLLMQSKFQDSFYKFTNLNQKWPDDGPTLEFLKRSRSYLDEPEIFTKEYKEGIYIACGK